jgi:uncharacterized membrane protein YphA (DoxX/SURF4 family)
MSVALWVLQILLAAQFLLHGFLYVAPPADMIEQMDAILPPQLRVFIGVAEILAAVGLVLPAATRVLPWLTPLAAAGLMIVTLSATGFHLSRGESGNAALTALLFVFATLVAYGRWRMLPITSRGHRGDKEVGLEAGSDRAA